MSKTDCKFSFFTAGFRFPHLILSLPFPHIPPYFSPSPYFSPPLSPYFLPPPILSPHPFFLCLLSPSHFLTEWIYTLVLGISYLIRIVLRMSTLRERLFEIFLHVHHGFYKMNYLDLFILGVIKWVNEMTKWKIFCEFPPSKLVMYVQG